MLSCMVSFPFRWESAVQLLVFHFISLCEAHIDNVFSNAFIVLVLSAWIFTSSANIMIAYCLLRGSRTFIVSLWLSPTVYIMVFIYIVNNVGRNGETCVTPLVTLDSVSLSSPLPAWAVVILVFCWVNSLKALHTSVLSACPLGWNHTHH